MPYIAWIDEGASSPIGYVGGSSKIIPASTGSNTSVSLTTLTGGLNSAPVAGDFMVVAYSANNNNSSFDIQMISSGWTQQCDLQSPFNTFASQMAVFTKVMGASPDTSCTVGPTGSGADSGIVVVTAWRGVNQTTPMDVAVGTGSNSGSGNATPDPGPITPVTQGAMIVVAGHKGVESNGFTVMGDLTKRVIRGGDGTLGVGSISWSGSGAYDCPVWTGGSNEPQAGCTWCVMALRPA